MKLEFFIPPELEREAPDLKRFVDAMIFKLRKNAHKGTFKDADLSQVMELLGAEVVELAQAITERNTAEILLEAADVANFALVCSAIAIARDTPFEPKANGAVHPAMTYRP